MSESQTEAAKPPWVHHYIAILPDATGARVLMLPSPEGWRLPHLTLEGVWLSETAKIIPAFKAAFDLELDFTILRYVSYEVNEEKRWDRIFFVLEPRQLLQQPPLDGRWVDQLSLYHMQLALPEQRAPLLQYLEENEQGNNPPLIDPRRSPWARPGWFAAASTWIAQAIAAAGATQSGPVEQMRNWSISSLLVTPTSAGQVYFKAAAALPLFVNEPALTQTLSELYPSVVPKPLKIDREQRWMLMEDFHQVRWSEGEMDLPSILQAFGKLQRDSATHVEQLTEAGCIDRRLPVLVDQIDHLLADPITQAALGAEEYAALLALGPQLKERCAQVAEYNLPATLLHGDLHLGNITQHNGAYLFFDWTDACIGFPFLDLFVLYFSEEGEGDPIQGRDAYLAVWQDFESPTRLLEAWELAKPLCALHHSVSYLSIVNHIEPLVREELFHGLPDNLHRLLASMRG